MTNVQVTGDLTVDGTAVIDDMITCRSNGFFTGFFRVGALAGVGFNVLEFAQINQTLSVGGNTTLAGDAALTTGDLLVAAGDLTVGGTSALTGDVTLQGALTLATGDLLVTAGNLTVGGTSALTGDVTLQGALTLATGDLLVTAGNLTVGGSTVLQGELTRYQRRLIDNAVVGSTLLTQIDSGTIVRSTAASGVQTFNLPSVPSNGTTFTFVRTVANATMLVQASGGASINTITAAGVVDNGSARSNLTGSFIFSPLTLVYNAAANIWIGMAPVVGWNNIA